MPVLQEIGTDQEQAAADARRVALADLLADHPALDPLGRHLRRRAGDRARARRVRGRRVVSGKISGQTETLPLFVENQYDELQPRGRLRGGDRARDPRPRGALRMNLLRRGPKTSEADDGAPMPTRRRPACSSATESKGGLTMAHRGRERDQALRRLRRARRRLDRGAGRRPHGPARARAAAASRLCFA